MQPYLFPYLGYFHLIDAVDVFVILDNVDYPKGGWVNRNRILIQGTESWLTFPVGSEGGRISHKKYVLKDREFFKIQRMIGQAYAQSPRTKEFQNLLAEWWHSPVRAVSEVNMFFTQSILRRLGRSGPLFVQPDSLRIGSATGQDRILRIAEILGATSYINLAGGATLYDKSAFHDAGVELLFVHSKFEEYAQKSNEFVPGVSILDFFLNETGDAEGWLGPQSYCLEPPQS